MLFQMKKPRVKRGFLLIYLIESHNVDGVRFFATDKHGLNGLPNNQITD